MFPSKTFSGLFFAAPQKQRRKEGGGGNSHSFNATVRCMMYFKLNFVCDERSDLN
jgi:hypothetical protein